MSKKPSLLIIGKVWPEPCSSAAGSRMMQLIDLFLAQNWKITFASAAGESEFAEDLSDMKIGVSSIKLNDSSFDIFVKDLNPDIVLFDRFMTEEQFGWRVAEQCPDALRILDTEDLHCLRTGRHQALKEGRVFTENDLFSDYAKREIASIYRSDLSLIISEVEMELLANVFKVDKELLHFVPFMFGPVSENQIKKLPSFDEREHFISIGNFLHEPNWDAVKYLKESIWNKIRAKLPKAELHVYGAYPSQKVFQLHNPKEGFIIKGRAEDALEVMRKAKVCLAPIRFGAGLKGKLTDAMQSGTPSVTTSIGAEAMQGSLDWAGFIEDDPDMFVNASSRLYSEQELWSEAQSNGISIIECFFSKEKYSSGLLKRIELLLSDIENHRKNNFTGAMLLHHTSQSTKFMSKWIEEKNK